MAIKGLVGVKECAGALGIPFTWLRDEIRKGTIPSLKAGSKTYVSQSAVEEALVKLAGAQPTATPVASETEST